MTTTSADRHQSLGNDLSGKLRWANHVAEVQESFEMNKQLAVFLAATSCHPATINRNHQPFSNMEKVNHLTKMCLWSIFHNPSLQLN